MRTEEELLLKIDLWIEGTILESCKDLESGTHIAIWRELNMFGYGDSLENAIKDLLNCLNEYYDILKEKENDSLGPVCIRDKEILNKFFNY